MDGSNVLNSFTFSWGRKEAEMIIIQCGKWLLENYAQGFMRISRMASWKEGRLEWIIEERRRERVGCPERQRQEKAWPVEGKVGSLRTLEHSHN